MASRFAGGIGQPGSGLAGLAGGHILAWAGWPGRQNGGYAVSGLYNS